MKEIIGVGSLLQAPHLSEGDSDGGTCHASVPVIVTERLLTDGTWSDWPPMRYLIYVSGDQARNLTRIAQQCGNVGVVFAGELRPGSYEAADGEQGIGLEVRVRELAISLRGQIAEVMCPDGAPIGPRRDEDANDEQ